MKKRVKKIYNNFVEAISLPEMRILPGQIAFCFLMSFIPIITIITMIISYEFSNINVLEMLKGVIPESLTNIIFSIINTDPSYNIVLILVCYIMLASNGPGAISLASDTLYGIKSPNYIKLKLKSIIMIILMTLLMIFLIIIPVFGDTIVIFILKLIPNPERFYAYTKLYKLLKILLVFITIFINVKLIYTMAPNKRIDSSTTTFGALFTTITWIISTELFSIYITKIARYSLIYGNFANVLIMLLWVYLLSYLFVVGMAINAHSNSDIVKEDI